MEGAIKLINICLEKLPNLEKLDLSFNNISVDHVDELNEFLDEICELSQQQNIDSINLSCNPIISLYESFINTFINNKNIILQNY